MFNVENGAGRRAHREIYFVRIHDEVESNEENQIVGQEEDEFVAFHSKEFVRTWLNAIDYHAANKKLAEHPDIINKDTVPLYLHDIYDSVANDWAVLLYRKKIELPVLKNFNALKFSALPLSDKDNDERRLHYVTYDFTTKAQNQMVENFGNDFKPSNISHHQQSQCVFFIFVSFAFDEICLMA